MVIQRELTKQTGVPGICYAISIIEIVCLHKGIEADFQDVVSLIRAGRTMKVEWKAPGTLVYPPLIGPDGYIGDAVQLANTVRFHFGISGKYKSLKKQSTEPEQGPYIVKLANGEKTHFVAFFKDVDGNNDSRDSFPGYTKGYKIVEYRLLEE